MNRIDARRASVALAAAVALFFVSAAFSQPPSIISSFRLTGATPPGPRGIHLYGTSIFVISYNRPNENYLYQYSWQGSFISSFILPGARALGDADRLPGTYPSYYFAVVDTGANDVKIYTTAASLVGTFFPPPPGTVAIGVGGHVVDLVYYADAGGVIYLYSPQGSFIRSFATGVATGDLTASGGYAYRWGYFVQLSPRGAPGPIYSYTEGGSLFGSFILPGTRNCGAMVLQPSNYYCIRQVSTELWIYSVYLGTGMPVEPASLGKVKALYK
jgi:hypothetical protein